MKEYYVFKINHTYSLQNKLQEAIFNYLKDWDRCIDAKEDLPRIKQFVKNDIAEICKKFPRCKPIIVEFHEERNKSYSDWIVMFRGASICHSAFYYAKNLNV